MAVRLFQDSVDLDEERIIRASENVRQVKDESTKKQQYWVIDERNSKEKIHLTWGRLDPNLCFELIHRNGSLIVQEQGFVPVSTARLGKPAIAAYLRVSVGWRSNRIADALDVSKETVNQYLSDFAKGER